MDLKETAISGVKWTTIDKIGKAIFQLLQVVILTRFLPKEAFGLIAMALVVVNFSNTFVDMGLTTAILHKQDATQEEYSSIYWLNIFTSLGIYVLLYISTPLLADFYSEKALLHIVPILGLNVLLIAMGRQHRTILQKEFRFKRITIIELSAFLTGLLVAVILAYKGFGVYSLVVSTLVKSAVSNIVFFIINYKYNPIKLYFSFQDTKEFVHVGGYQMGSSLLGFISKEADILIIGRLLGAEALGLYSLSKQIVLKVYSLVGPIITTVLSPLLSSIQKDRHRLKRTYLKIVKYLAYINFPIYLIIIVLSKEILFFAYGKSYVEGYLVLSFLSIYYCFNSLSNPVGSLQISTGRTDIGFIWAIFRTVVTSIFMYVGAMYGVNGVGIAHALLSTIMIVPMWYIQLRPMANILLDEYMKQFYKPLLVFIVLGFLGMGIELFLDAKHYLFSIIVKQVLFMSIFAVLLYITDNRSFRSFFKFILSSY